MSKVNVPAIFISALKKENMEQLRAALIEMVKEIHFIRYPNDRANNSYE